MPTVRRFEIPLIGATLAALVIAVAVVVGGLYLVAQVHDLATSMNRLTTQLHTLEAMDRKLDQTNAKLATTNSSLGTTNAQLIKMQRTLEAMAIDINKMGRRIEEAKLLF